MATSSVAYNKPVFPRVSDTSDLGSNRASVYSGKGLSFDGVNDQVEVDNSFFNEDAHTVCGYIKKEGTGTYRTVFGVDKTHAVPQAGLYIQTPGSASTFYAIYYSETSNETVYFTNDLAQGVWYHFAVTFDNGDIKAYWNGELVDTGTLSGTWTKDRNITIGAGWYNNAIVDFWDGDLSNFKVFNTAITAAQVKELYENPEQAVPTGVAQTSLMAHFPMTEGAGSYLHNANQGALGTELISNGGFDETCQKWGTTDSNDVEIVNGKAIWTNAPLSGSFVKQPLDLEIGKFYRVSFDYTSTGFNIFANLGNTQQAVQLGNGRASFDMYYGSGDSSLSFQHGYLSDSSATVDNVSVKEVVPSYIIGTISGATWVSGLPEPLPQTALMDWNKATNRSEYSEDLTQSAWTKNAVTATGEYISSPLGLVGGVFNVVPSTSNVIHLIQDGSYSVSGGSYYVASAWFKANGYRYAILSFSGYGNWTGSNGGEVSFDLYNGTASPTGGAPYDYGIEAYADGWYKCYTIAQATTSFTSNVNFFASSLATSNSFAGDGTSGIYMFGLQTQIATTVGTYVPTYANAQTSPVLIQEGSTSGKDIFGNSIAVPRSSGAFNFDGASWAEVQDNASTDMTTAVSVEAWVYNTGKSNGKGIVGKWNYPNYGSYLLYNNSTNSMNFFINDAVGTSGSTSIPTGWSHFVGTYDKTTIKLYKNGVLVSSSSYTSDLIDSGSSPVEIGKYSQNITTLYQEQIANPRIYNFALTAEQVADNYNQKATTVGATSTISELQAYINRTNAAGATVEAHPSLLNTLTELDSK